MNQRDEQDKKHGYWEVYHINGNLHYKGHYLNGEQHGYWEQYYENGQLWYKGHFLNGEKHGYWEEYHPDGELRKTEYYARM
ncbi:MORN variant [uncultured Caudovirales phage]|uniref:MORN variant n=1 Tax=uncultured Caudovirales phage TaxID=2100421 RepID=A0A6J5M7Y2_9CAUD|nr:MORN variant [uncultured Caudovirales phage]